MGSRLLLESESPKVWAILKKLNKTVLANGRNSFSLNDENTCDLFLLYTKKTIKPTTRTNKANPVPIRTALLQFPSGAESSDGDEQLSKMCSSPPTALIVYTKCIPCNQSKGSKRVQGHSHEHRDFGHDSNYFVPRFY